MGDDEDEYVVVVVLEKVVENDERDLELEGCYDLAIHDKDFVLGDSFEHEPFEKKSYDYLKHVMKNK